MRIELFGDEIELIRRFEVASQRSLAARCRGYQLFSTRRRRPRVHGLLSAVELVPVDRAGRPRAGRKTLSLAARQAAGLSRRQRGVAAGVSVPIGYRVQQLQAASLETTCRLKIESVERFSGDIAKVRQELDSVGTGQTVYVDLPDRSRSRRLADISPRPGWPARDGCTLSSAGCASGFRLVNERIALVSGNELFQRTDLTRPGRRLGRVIDSFLELREGDLVVHLTTASAAIAGCSWSRKRTRPKSIWSSNSTGGPRSTSRLEDRPGAEIRRRRQEPTPRSRKSAAAAWERQKEALAEQAVIDLAADMLDIQAVRGRSRASPSRPTATGAEFEAAFPYQETPDQLSAIDAIKGDMRQPRPMDRLICGDVGYGKTEVAMRAAFKAVDGGKQVAVLVPTTILAEQHQRSFAQRMAEFPVHDRRASTGSAASREKRVLERRPPARSTSSSARTAWCRRTCTSRTSAWWSSTRNSGSASRTRNGSKRCAHGRRADACRPRRSRAPCT